MRKLYHISEDYDKHIELFVPDIPESACLSEDYKTKRICTSSSLEGCLKGHPNTWYDMVEYPNKEYTYPEWVMDKMAVLLDYGEITGHLYKVYEFNVDDKHIVFSETLFQENLVPDAIISEEHWILKDTMADRVFYLFVTEAFLVNDEKCFKYVLFEENEIGRIADGYYHFANFLSSKCHL